MMTPDTLRPPNPSSKLFKRSTRNGVNVRWSSETHASMWRPASGMTNHICLNLLSRNEVHMRILKIADLLCGV